MDKQRVRDVQKKEERACEAEEGSEQIQWEAEERRELVPTVAAAAAERNVDEKWICFQMLPKSQT